MEYELVPLHENKLHTDDCVTILNAEWPRSKAARQNSLSRSCDSLPCCLVFRRVDSKKVIGFSLVSAVQGKGRSCLFESVIIDRDLRGKGLGRVLMKATEQYAKRLNFKTAYLSTLDKKSFYSHLGYTECGPVISLGANASRVSEEFLQKILGTGATDPPTQLLLCHMSIKTPVLLDRFHHHHYHLHHHHLPYLLHPLHQSHPLLHPHRNGLAVLTLSSADMSYVWTQTLSHGCANPSSKIRQSDQSVRRMLKLMDEALCMHEEITDD